MNLFILTTAALYAQIVQLLERLSQRSLLRQLPRVSPLVGDLVVARDRLKTHLSRTRDEATSRTEAPDELVSLATQVRRLVRGLDSLLSTAELLSVDGDQSARIASVRTRLFPDGLLNANATRATLANAVMEASVRLTSADRTVLRGIPSVRGNALVVAESLFEAANTLRTRVIEAEQQARTTDRAPRSAGLSENDDRVRAAQSLRLVLDTLEHESIDESVRLQLTVPIEMAVRSAAEQTTARKSRRAASERRKEAKGKPSPANDNNNARDGEKKTPVDTEGKQRPAA